LLRATWELNVSARPAAGGTGLADLGCTPCAEFHHNALQPTVHSTMVKFGTHITVRQRAPREFRWGRFRISSGISGPPVIRNVAYITCSLSTPWQGSVSLVENRVWVGKVPRSLVTNVGA
jgi:hypothetical protein